MKKRYGFVTNSSSSSYILTNKTNKTLTGEKIALELEDEFNDFKKEYDYISELQKFKFQDFVSSGKERNLSIKPQEAIVIECGDHFDDGLFEMLIHASYGINKEDFSIKFLESHH